MKQLHQGHYWTGCGVVIMITRNNLHLTKAALASIKKLDGSPDILIFDNNSTDGTVEYLTTSTSVFTIFSNKQLSLSACWNKCLQVVFHLGYQSALVVNNDIELRPDTYTRLRLTDLPFVTAVSVGSVEQMMDHDESKPFDPRPHPDFSCFMIRPEVYTAVGPFDESYYPAYGEDADWHVRAHRAGYNLYCVDLPFLHHSSGTLKYADEYEKRLIEKGADANRNRFRNKYGVEIGTQEYYDLFT